MRKTFIQKNGKLFYNDFNDTIYKTIMDSAKNMVVQYKKYTVNLKINEISKDFV